MNKNFLRASLIPLIFFSAIQGLRFSASSIMGGTVSKVEFDDNMYNKPIPDVILTESIHEFNGRKINVSRWTPISPKAIVLVSHGLHEHGMRYHSVAESLTAKNYLVVAIDQSSHGLSQGTRGLITDYTALPLDFVSLAKEVHIEYPNLPSFILAHSMGTLVATLAINELSFVKVSTDL